MDTTPQTNLTVDQLVADWGAYYIDAGQGESNLHRLPFEAFKSRDAFTNIETNDTVLREMNVEVEDILQQYQDDFTPKGGITIDPVQIQLYKMKIDLELNPHKIQASYAGFLASNNTDVTTWPIVRYMMEVYIWEKSQEELELNAIYKGVHEAPEAGVPGESSKVMDGVEKIQDDLIAAGKLTPITFGTPSTTPATFVGQVEDMIKAMPEKYREMTMSLNMNLTLAKRFREGMRAKYNTQYNQISDRLAVADQENITVVGRASQRGKNRIWATPKYNALFGVKGFTDKGSFQVEKSKRKVAIYGEWWMGAGFIQPEILFITDGEV